MSREEGGTVNGAPDTAAPKTGEAEFLLDLKRFSVETTKLRKEFERAIERKVADARIYRNIALMLAVAWAVLAILFALDIEHIWPQHSDSILGAAGSGGILFQLGASVLRDVLHLSPLAATSGFCAFFVLQHRRCDQDIERTEKRYQTRLYEISMLTLFSDAGSKREFASAFSRPDKDQNAEVVLLLSELLEHFREAGRSELQDMIRRSTHLHDGSVH